MSLMVVAQKGHKTKMKILSPYPKGLCQLCLVVCSFVCFALFLGGGGCFWLQEKARNGIYYFMNTNYKANCSHQPLCCVDSSGRQENLTWTLSYLIRPLKYRTGTLLAAITGSFRDFLVSRFYREDTSEDIIFTKQGICRNFRRTKIN